MDLLKEAELYMDRNCIERAISDAVSDAVAARDPDPMAFIADRLLQWQPHPVRAALDACHPARDALYCESGTSDDGHLKLEELRAKKVGGLGLLNRFQGDAHKVSAGASEE